nr:T9SS type A sorting domain-containing protein [Hymenobacter properus]
MTTGTPFSQAVALSAGTYYIRAYATNATGTGYGSLQTLTVNPAPTISSLSPSSIVYASGATTLTINGTGFISGVTTATYNTVGRAVTFISSTQISINVTVTDANTVGTVPVAVTNPTAGGGSASANFTVAAQAPTVSTTAVTTFSYTTATAPGNISSNNGASITERGVYYSTTPGIVATGGGTKQAAGTAASGTYSVSLTGLTPGTTYYVAAYAINSVGTSFGGEVSFTTPALTSPTLTTAAVSSITQTTATAGGNVTADGGASVTDRGVVYSTTTGPTTATGVTVAAGTPTGTGSFTASLTGLTAATTYFVRAYATNSVGTSYGPEVTFTTLAPTATITTGTVSPTPVCATTASNVTVAFTTTNNPTGTFTAQLSNASGTFATTPPTLATVSSTASSLTVTIPAGTASGTGYRIRVVTPSTTGAASTAFTIVNNPTVTIAPSTNQSYVVGSAGSVLTATETPSATANTRVWQVSTTSSSTGFADVVPTQTGTTYTPTFGTVGVYYVRAVSTFAACAAATSNAVTVTVNNPPTPTITTVTPSSGFAGSTVSSLVVAGSNYTNASVIYFNGVAQTTTYATASSLSVPNFVLPTTAGNYNVTVVNSNGATSNAVQFQVMPAPLVTYKTTGLTGSTIAVSPTNVAANSSASTLTRSGVTAASGSDVYSSSGFDATSATAPDLSKYLTFNYTVAPGYRVSFDNVIVSISRSGTTSPQNVELRVSTDGTNFTNPISLGVKTLTNTSSPVQSTFAVPSGTLQGVTSPLYFRLYAFNGTNSGATFRLDDFTPSIPAVIANGTVTQSAPVPEINLAQGSTNIASGTGSFAFATTIVGSSTANTSFSIQNTGNNVLNLTANPIVGVVSGDAADFNLTQPSAAVVAAGSSLPFTIAFAPTSTGAKTLTLSIYNDDSDENPYTFTVTGNGVVAPVVTSFTPTSGPVGTVVTITGTDFTAASTVSFNGTAATAVTFNSTTSLTATVPTGATTGPITVATAYGSSTSTTSFTVTVTPTAGQLLLEDNFAYAAGENLTDHGWTGFSTTTSAPPVTIANNLTMAQYPRGFDQNELATFAGSSTARLSNVNNQDVSRAFGATTSSTLYASAVISVTATASGGDYFLAFADAANAVPRGRIYIARTGTAASGTFQFGVGTGSAGTYTTGTPYNSNTSYLVVLKYTVNNTNNTQTASLFVYTGAADPNEPSQPLVSTSGPLSSGLGALANIILRQADNAVNLDGVRVASNWGTVIGRPVYVDETTTLQPGSYYNVAVSGNSSLTTTGAASVEGTLNLGGGKINTDATNLLSLTATATFTGGSASSFVNGPLARATAAGVRTTVFPIGSGTFYRPLTLNVATQTNTVTYTASQTEGNAGQSLSASNGLGTAPLQRVSYKRFYTVTPNVAPTGFSGTITLSFGAEDYVNTPADPGFVVAKRDAVATDPNDNGKWTNLGHSAESGTASGPGGASVVGTITSATFTGFSDFALGATNDLTNVNGINAVNPLPVQLSSFGAQRQAQQGVAVKWTTATEKNAAYFEVQRSLNTRDFVTVATAKAQGTSSRATAYTVLDQTAPAAALYYRLRQVDADGTVAFSPVVVVAGTGEVAKVLLYPNPTRGTIHFITEAATPYRVLNQLGQALLQGTTEAGTATVDASTLPAGLYFLELQTPNGRNVQKFEKQ